MRQSGVHKLKSETSETEPELCGESVEEIVWKSWTIHIIGPGFRKIALFAQLHRNFFAVKKLMLPKRNLLY